MDWVVVVAIVLGPVLAILVSRHLDNRREKHARQMDIFRTLMRTRRTPVYPDHVGALNLIEIEFADNAKVVSEWKDLFKHLGNNHTRSEAEAVSSDMPPDEAGRRNEAFDKRLFDERQKLLAKVLHAIAQDLGFKVEQLEIFEGGYTPQGWVDIDLQQRIIRQFIVDLCFGHRVVPVGVVDYTQAKPLEQPATQSAEPPPWGK